MRQTGDSLIATMDESGYLCLNNMHVLVPEKSQLEPAYILGVVNSRFMNWYYHTLNPEIGEALAEVKKTNVAVLPIRTINFSDKSEQARHSKMVTLAERMSDLHKRLANAKTPDAKARLQRQIDATDHEIDQLVYDLYGLTEDEIRIVEGTAVASAPKA